MTQRLQGEPSPASSDALFDILARAHDGLDCINSARLNSAVILLLANHIGSLSVVEEAVSAALELLHKKGGLLPTSRI